MKERKPKLTNDDDNDVNHYSNYLQIVSCQRGFDIDQYLQAHSQFGQREPTMVMITSFLLQMRIWYWNMSIQKTKLQAH